MFETIAETIVVILTIVVVLVLAGRSVYRTVAGKKQGQCCGCGSCACGNIKKQD
jgi:hypothetical protein